MSNRNDKTHRGRKDRTTNNLIKNNPIHYKWLGNNLVEKSMPTKNLEVVKSNHISNKDNYGIIGVFDASNVDFLLYDEKHKNFECYLNNRFKQEKNEVYLYHDASNKEYSLRFYIDNRVDLFDLSAFVKDNLSGERRGLRLVIGGVPYYYNRKNCKYCSCTPCFKDDKDKKDFIGRDICFPSPEKKKELPVYGFSELKKLVGPNERCVRDEFRNCLTLGDLINSGAVQVRNRNKA